jgi:hypothetical protein
MLHRFGDNQGLLRTKPEFELELLLGTTRRLFDQQLALYKGVTSSTLFQPCAVPLSGSQAAVDHIRMKKHGLSIGIPPYRQTSGSDNSKHL